MFVIEVQHKDKNRGREYIAESDTLGKVYSPNLQKAHPFIEQKDITNVPWTPEEEEAKELEVLLALYKPMRIQVIYCDKCASLRFIKGSCPICGARQGMGE